MSTTLSVTARINPYPGLASFQEKDAARFFGRDREIEEILDRLASHRLLAVIGVSGCGKSSLVRAGVIPVLKIGAAERLPFRWQICTITPGDAPLNSLHDELGAPANWPSISFDLVDLARNTLLQGEALLLIVDQFEEIFGSRDETVPQDSSDASLFVDLLLKAVDQREVPIYILLTMRADFLGQCSQFRGLPEALNDCYYLVPRMTRLQQQQAIELPLQAQSEAIHPALVQRLLNDSTDDPDQLPILQHLLSRLWTNWSERDSDGPISIVDYEKVGGWAGALDNDAEAVLKQFEAYEGGIQRVFQWITEHGIGEQPIRRPRPFGECLAVSGLERRRLTEVIRAFQVRGLLRPSDLSDESLVDLSHECVMWQWSRLKRWIDEEAEQATQMRFFWQSAHRKVSLSGRALESALQWQMGERKRTPLAQRYLTNDQLQQTETWIIRSEQIEKAKQRWRKRLFVSIPIFAIVLAVVAIWIAQNQRNQRNTAQAREISAWAATSLGEDPERSLILGLHAWGKQQASVNGLNQILHDALLQSSGWLTLQGHQDTVLGIAWSHDGRKLATASGDKTAKVWEAGTGRELLTLSGHQKAVLSVAWSPDSNDLATASADQKVKVWDTGTGQELLTLSGHEGAVFSVAWSPDGSKLATASSDQTAKVWDARTGRDLLTLSGHRGLVRSIAWSPDGNKLATASDDGTVKLWDAERGHELITFGSHQRPILSVAWSPDGSRLATSDGKATKVWEAKTGGELLSLSGHQDRVLSIAWSPDGSKLATASYDKTTKVWDVQTGDELLTLRGHQAAVLGVTWSPDGRKLATASYDKTAKVWRAGLGHELLILEGHQKPIKSVAWSPDGRLLATAGDDKAAQVWEADTGGKRLTLPEQSASVLSIAWSPDSSKLATASGDETKVWDARTKRELLDLGGHQKLVRSVVWSPDGSKLATASEDATARVWDAVTGRELLTLSGHQGKVSGIAWSPDGRKLATAGDDKTARVWDAGTGHTLLTLSGHGSFVRSVAWSPEGARLATASDDGTAKIWDNSTGRELLTLRGHIGSVLSIQWSADGSKLATAGKDETTRVWAADTGRELLTLHGHQGSVLSLAWSPDGKRLASAGDDKIVQVYAVDLIELLRLVRSRITRNLTSEECSLYLNTDRCPTLPEVP